MSNFVFVVAGKGSGDIVIIESYQYAAIFMVLIGIRLIYIPFVLLHAFLRNLRGGVRSSAKRNEY